MPAHAMPRRHPMLTLLAAAAIAAVAFAGPSSAEPRHGLSAFGELKYPPDFKHFDYVNPDAPKGGVFSQIGPSRLYNQNFLTFNSLNSFILKGDAAQGLEYLFDSLMARAMDEHDEVYGLVESSGEVAADK